MVRQFVHHMHHAARKSGGPVVRLKNPEYKSFALHLAAAKQAEQKQAAADATIPTNHDAAERCSVRRSDRVISERLNLRLGLTTLQR
jgi:hypothetical protein